MTTAPELCIILAEAQGNSDTDRALRAVETACAGRSVEVVVVRPAGRVSLPDTPHLSVREIRCDADALVPVRWGLGVHAANAPLFACLTTELAVRPDWATRLGSIVVSSADGAAGSIGLAPEATRAARAMYFVRFNAFLPRDDREAHEVHHIPGDAAVYRLETVRRYPDLLTHGFWEAEFHRRMLADGGHLVLVGDTLSDFGTAMTLRAALGIRYRHGRDFGTTRVRSHGEAAGRVLLAAPIVPILMLARVLRRATSSGGSVARLAWQSAGAIGLLCIAWAWGEARGAVASGAAR